MLEPCLLQPCFHVAGARHIITIHYHCIIYITCARAAARRDPDVSEGCTGVHLLLTCVACMYLGGVFFVVYVLICLFRGGCTGVRVNAGSAGLGPAGKDIYGL